MIFRKSLVDIHAQPNLFHRSMLKNINYLPDNMILDLYVLLSAKIKKYEVLRFKVKFLRGNMDLGQMIIYSKSKIFFTFHFKFIKDIFEWKLLKLKKFY